MEEAEETDAERLFSEHDSQKKNHEQITDDELESELKRTQTLELQIENLKEVSITQEFYLPPEIILCIFKFLDGESLLTTSYVSKQWHAISNSTSLWKRVCERKWHYIDQDHYQENWKSIFLCNNCKTPKTVATIGHHADDLLRKKHFHQAVKAYTEGIRLAGNKSNYWYNRGIAHEALREYDQAITDYTTAIELQPKPAYYNNRAVAKERKKLYDSAIEDYTIAIGFAPTAARFYANRADTFEALKQLDRALLDYDTAIRLQPDCANYYYRRGEVFRILGQYEEAIENYSTALNFELKPWYYKHRAMAKSKLKLYEEVIEDYTSALEFQQCPDYYNNRAVAYNSLKRFSEAIQDFSRAIELKPTMAAYYYNCGIAHEGAQQYAQAIENYSRAIEISPYSSSYHNNRGVAYEALRQYELAIADYTESIRLQPKPRYYNNRAEAFQSIGNFSQAIKDYLSAFRLKQDPAFVVCCAEIYGQLEDYSRAIDEYSRAIDLKPSSGKFNNRGWYYLLSGQIPQAISDAKRAIELNPHNDNAYDTLGFAFSLLGNHQQALEYYQLAFNLVDSDSTSKALYYLHWASSAFELSRFEEALEHVNISIELFPSLLISFGWRAMIFFALKNYSLASEDFLKVIHLNSVDKNDVNTTSRTGYQIESLLATFRKHYANCEICLNNS